MSWRTRYEESSGRNSIELPVDPFLAPRAGQAQGDAHRRDLRAVRDHHPHDLPLLRAHGHVDGDLLSPLGHGVGEDAEEADGPQDQRQDGGDPQGDHGEGELGISLTEHVRRLVAAELEGPSPEADPSAVFNLGSSSGSDVAREKGAMLAEALRGSEGS
jgi:hypothetical protein